MYYSKNLEIHIVDHCNLDCIGCSHESPLIFRRWEDPDLLGHYLSVLWKCYQAPLIKLLGGEPLLHPRIDEIISVVKKKTATRLRIVTNGTLLKQRYKRLRGIDEIHISSYPSVQIPGDDILSSIAAELGISITIQVFEHFRWYRSQPRYNQKINQLIFTTCQLYHSWQCHTLRDGLFYACPPAATWASGKEEGVDLIAAGSDLRAKIKRLFIRKKPFASCNECLGSVGQRFKHQLGWRRFKSVIPELALDVNFLLCLLMNRNAHNGCFEYKRTFFPSGDVKLHRGSL